MKLRRPSIRTQALIRRFRLTRTEQGWLHPGGWYVDLFRTARLHRRIGWCGGVEGALRRMDR